MKGDVKLPIFDINISIFPLYPLWSTTTKWNHDMLKECTSFIEIYDFIFAGNRELDLFTAVIWSLWNQCKNLRLRKPTLPLDKVLDFAREHLTEHPSSTLTSSNPQQHRATTWIAPEAYDFKVNFDGATFADDDTAGLGVVIR